MELFGIRLKGIRQERGLTQTQLADKLGIVKATVSSYEQTLNYPSIETFIKLCNFFDVSADFMLGLSDDMDIKMSHLTDEQISLIMSLINQFERLNKT
ncbi:MAG: helix-turn-helix domain-containing protein [Defluviitaleaceae bacterium]|nr:helix-turn-helix domain-containing protein [Defluviitaleaceae bacterium]MCL2262377.1 helix-turn-helix domain-containing protein [Defluviitaleaceae bacterium]